MQPLEKGAQTIILQHLPTHLLTVTEEDPVTKRPGKQGWCKASEFLLRTMLGEDNLVFEGFRQATLRNGDVVSSLVDLSQPVSDNKWAFVPYAYDAGGNADFCVVQILFYARIRVGAEEGVPTFCPEQCEAAGVDLEVDPSGSCFEAEPLRVAVTKMWLAEACDNAMGAVGCESKYGEATGVVPDLLVVSNTSETARVHGRGRHALRNGIKGRYFGHYLVDHDHIRCQLVRAGTDGGPQFFMTCGKLSGKP